MNVKMAVKHVPTGVVHSGKKGGKTECGFDTTEHASHWAESHEKINCEKDGCK